MLYYSRWQTIGILFIVLAGLVFTTPNFFPKATVQSWPDFVPSRQMNLGLDLRGGSQLLYEVDVGFIVRERLENLQDDLRLKLREKRIPFTGLRLDANALYVTIADRARQSEARSEIEKLVQPTGAPVAFGGERSPVTIALTGDEFVLTFTEEARREATRKAVDQAIEIVRRRVDAIGVSEPSIQRQGLDRILLQLPGVKNPQVVKDIVGQTAKMTFHLVDDSASPEDAANGRVPPGSEVLFGADEPKIPYVVRRRSLVSGENLTDAQATIDNQTGQYVVSFTFDSAGARRFGDATRENVGRPFAIVLDDKVISAPVIREPILGGRGQISGGGAGGFSPEEANNLAVLLRAGALPAPMTVLEERTVGAELGADSIEAGTIAAIVAFAAVALFMIIAYGLFGVFANLALLSNVLLIFGTLSLLGGTLTLPGIAGIVLTIGMAVDANVLIYERIKDELRAGKTPVNAITAGFSRAFSAILDSNVTTLLSALILFQLGAGPVRGFAVTLAVGVITSVFTAIVVTRLIIAAWYAWTRPKTLKL